MKREFYLVLLGFTGFYWVLLGFTDFTEFLRPNGKAELVFHGFRLGENWFLIVSNRVSVGQGRVVPGGNGFDRVCRGAVKEHSAGVCVATVG